MKTRHKKRLSSPNLTPEKFETIKTMFRLGMTPKQISEATGYSRATMSMVNRYDTLDVYKTEMASYRESKRQAREFNYDFNPNLPDFEEELYVPQFEIEGTKYTVASWGPAYSDGSRQATLRVSDL